jgi:sphingolipid delta-4 desaturase
MYIWSFSQQVDIPTSLEGNWFYTVPGKFFFVFMQPFFYALRPVLVYPKEPGVKEFLNYAAVIGFNVCFGYQFGACRMQRPVGMLLRDR